ncbi:Ig-like domain-containing protein [Vibrio agarivorans]|uniref:Ig-like domain-containing protein n=1 Tax=Vibrio agarivorans TaxID=153622 RepID=UPI0025B4D98E|nr:Ig-like domain-containing protein [Vibrio agarivorans]MDN3660164.1 Ig-like domain-containing protein [Vibrio agarivorans]
MSVKTKLILSTLASSLAFASSAIALEDSTSLLEVFVTPYGITLDEGQTHQMNARGFYGDRYEVVTEKVEWHSSNPETVPVTRDGVVFGSSVGLGQIYATLDGHESTNPATVTVGEATIDELELELANRNLTVGDVVQARVFATLSDGQKIEVTESVDWSYAAENNAFEISNSGEITALNEGWGMVSTRTESVSSNQIRIDVSDASGPIYDLVIATPSSTTLAVGNAFKPSVQGYIIGQGFVSIDKIDGYYIEGTDVVRAQAGTENVIAISTGTANVYPIAGGMQAESPVVITVE